MDCKDVNIINRQTLKKYPIVILVFIFSSSWGQKQLVLLKGERVMHRFLPGDYIYVKVKNDPVRYHTYINNILDDAVVLGDDTISYRAIERTYTGQSKFLSGLGKTMVQVGVGLFVIDQFNTVVVQGNKATLDSGVTTFSIVCVGVGLPLMLIKKKGEEIGYKYKLLPIDSRSPFYRK
jgi:hypothetical protein